MASRKLLYYDSGDLKEMTSAEMVEIQKRMIYAYGVSPTAVLTVVSSSGALVDAIDDTRKAAGATSQSTTAFVAEGTTAEPTTVTVSYDKTNLAYTATSGISNTTDTGTTFPVYYDGSGSIQACSLADLKDTLLHPAIELMISGTESSSTAGTYTVTNSSSAATDYTNVSTTAIYVDTRADTSEYTAAGIPETLDQPSTITSYYLHRRDASANTPSRFPIVINGSNDLQEMSASTVDDILGDWLRYTAAHSADGYKVTYNNATSGGNTRGTAMVDTRLDGSGYWQTLQVSDDYRSQEFPNGSVGTITTYNLRINKG
ncbi:uncharacterized protein METZ01_LOCUS137329 [marine metagenome]|uniref:Uncharacterized protein n=1 Tax=marine metagenome TaxID=408172 RepID=A0A381Z5A7_9ZZZZ